MSENELENLMSQLNVNSNFNTNIDNLGVQTFGSRTTWSYPEEKYYARDGFKRKKPLPDSMLEKPIETAKVYIPKFNEFVIDDTGKRYETFTIPKKGARMDVEALSKNQLLIMFWNEHWKRTATTKAYYNLKKYAENKAPGLFENRGIPGGGNTNLYPSMVANGSVKPRQAQATRSGTAPPRKK